MGVSTAVGLGKPSLLLNKIGFFKSEGHFLLKQSQPCPLSEGTDPVGYKGQCFSHYYSI